MEELTTPIKYENKQLERIATLCKFECLHCYAVVSENSNAPRFDKLYVSFDDKYYICIYVLKHEIIRGHKVISHNSIYFATTNKFNTLYGNGIVIDCFDCNALSTITNEKLVKKMHETAQYSRKFCESRKLAPYDTCNNVKYYEVCKLRRYINGNSD